MGGSRVRRAARLALLGAGLVAAARWDARRPTGRQVAIRLSSPALRLLPVLPPPAASALLRAVRVERPPRSVARSASAEPGELGGVPVVWLNRAAADRGTVLYLHGGAYVFGPVGMQWRWAAALAEAAGVAVAVALYRMSPDHPHPAPLDDASAAAAALAGTGADRWVLAGDSAGGGLALALLQRLRAEGRPLPAATVLVAPWVDLALDHPGIPATARLDPVLGTGWLRWAAALHRGAAPLDDPLVSPVHADLAGLPPVHLSVGGRDLLVHDVRVLLHRLRDAGVAVEAVEEPDAVHIYPALVDAPEARATIAAQAAFVRRHLT